MKLVYTQVLGTCPARGEGSSPFRPTRTMNLRWTRKFAYAVGLITTDGSLSKDGRHVDFTSKDLVQVRTFRKIVKSRCKISIKKGGLGNTCFRMQLGNVKLYKLLLSIGLHSNKSKTIKEILVPDKYFIDFLRGHFDGDGYSYSYWDKVYPASFRLYLGFTSASKTHLEWIQRKLSKTLGLTGSIRISSRVYVLSYAKKNSVLLANKIYYRSNIICLKRKKYKIERALGIINRQAGMAKLVNAQS